MGPHLHTIPLYTGHPIVEYACRVGLFGLYVSAVGLRYAFTYYLAAIIIFFAPTTMVSVLWTSCRWPVIRLGLVGTALYLRGHRTLQTMTLSLVLVSFMPLRGTVGVLFGRGRALAFILRHRLNTWALKLKPFKPRRHTARRKTIRPPVL
jgi:hypothetical protein